LGQVQRRAQWRQERIDRWLHSHSRDHLPPRQVPDACRAGRRQCRSSVRPATLPPREPPRAGTVREAAVLPRLWRRGCRPGRAGPKQSMPLGNVDRGGLKSRHGVPPGGRSFRGGSTQRRTTSAGNEAPRSASGPARWAPVDEQPPREEGVALARQPARVRAGTATAALYRAIDVAVLCPCRVSKPHTRRQLRRHFEDRVAPRGQTLDPRAAAQLAPSTPESGVSMRQAGSISRGVAPRAECPLVTRTVFPHGRTQVQHSPQPDAGTRDLFRSDVEIPV
jgi:hypothetical protein